MTNIGTDGPTPDINRIALAVDSLVSVLIDVPVSGGLIDRVAIRNAVIRAEYRVMRDAGCKAVVAWCEIGKKYRLAEQTVRDIIKKGRPDSGV